MQRSVPTHHIRPRTGWINDPDGMTFHAGRWHVFFQHNARGAFHDLIHWGHVSSPDLLSWREHPVAFGPTPDGPDRFGCWSGVFVPGLDRPAVAYSGVVDDGLRSTVCLRWALDDDLDTWSDPVVVGTTPTDASVRVMRDPFVLTFEGRRWALLGAGLTDGTPATLLFSCDDILDWHFEEVWLTHADPVARAEAPADVWECPQLVRVGDIDVLVLALQTDGVLDRAVALTGCLEGVDGRPRLRPDGAVELDSGPLFYAPQCLADDGTGDGPLLFGWLRQEDIPGRPDDGLVAGCLTLPRRLVESGGRVRAVLDPRVAAAPGPTLRHEPGDVDLPRAAWVRVFGAWSLSGDEGELPVRDVPALVVVDGEVAEVYPDDGPPHADRQVGTTRWRLRCNTAVEVVEAP